jgi:hypothetical protein
VHEDKPFWFKQNNILLEAEPKDDLLHPERNKLTTADSATETQYFGFCVPEARIQAFCYLWHHPNLRVLSGGLFVWQGNKPTVVHGELCDFRNFMNDSALSRDLNDYTLDNSYSVKIVKPLELYLLRYSDPARSNTVALQIEALQAPVMFGDGNHFEQPMKVTGDLTLRGSQYRVNCFTVRDRSWGRPRPEDNPAVPAVSWMSGVFEKGFSFCVTVFDQKDTSLELSGMLAKPLHDTLVAGWVYREGRLGAVVEAHKRVIRSPALYIPTYIELELVDEHDRRIHLRGTSVASTVWQVWSNTLLPICQMRWECEEMTAYGECQEGNFNDHFYQLAKA